MSKIINTDLTKFNHLKAKQNTYYIDEENKLIARLELDSSDVEEYEEFRKYYTNMTMNIESIYDVFELKDGSFVIYSYIK